MYLRVLCMVCLLFCVRAYKILVVYPCPVKSLNILGEGFVRQLLKSGHEVTYITSYPLKERGKNLKQIDIHVNLKLMSADDGFNIQTVMDKQLPMNDQGQLQEFAYIGAQMTFDNENVTRFLEDTTQRFDAVIVDLYETEVYSGIAALYDCPMIWAYSMGAHWQPLRLIDEPTNPAYTADYLSSNMPPFNFQQRLQELWAHIKWHWLKWSSTMQKEKEIYQKFFGPLFAKRGKALPDYHSVIYNVSLMFGNEHHSFGNIPKIPLNFKLIGGYHIQSPAEPLPKELQSLMDDSKFGVIYFSMGSTWSSKHLPKTVIESLVAMFGELKQTVLWKFEADLPNLPPNLHIVKWAPQQSILAHPNCLFFITHGGLLSSTEAIHFGVPIVGIPIFFDQFININKAATTSYALQVALDYELPNNLRVAVRTMLDDPKYSAKAKELSSIYHDRPVPPGTEAVHWIEHVIRTQGAPHLRSPAFNVPFYQKLYLDLLATVTSVVVLLLCIIKRLMDRQKLVKKKVN